MNYSHGSVRDQFIHLIGADDLWFSELQNIYPLKPYQPADHDDRKEIRLYWDSIEQRMNKYLVDLRDDMLSSAPIEEPEDDKGLITWQVLLHVVNHATDHRAQMLRLLNELGAKTTYQDFIFYIYDHPF